MHILVILIILCTLSCTVSFTSHVSSIRSSISPVSRPKTHRSSTELQMGVFDSIREPVKEYCQFWIDTGMFQDLPQWLIHWGHGAAMSTVIIVMCGIGTFLGYQIRRGNGSGEYWFTLGKSAQEQHPLIMGLATFFMLAGGQGGLVLKLVQGEEILTSPHAVTAAVGLGLLFIQALLPLTFKGESGITRNMHTALGTGTMVALGSHLVTGLQLGLSF